MKRIFEIIKIFFLTGIFLNACFISYQLFKIENADPDMITDREIHEIAGPPYDYEMEFDEKLFEFFASKVFKQSPITQVYSDGKYLQVIGDHKGFIANMINKKRIAFIKRHEEFIDRPYRECLNDACIVLKSAEITLHDEERKRQEYYAWLNMKRQNELKNNEGIETLADKNPKEADL